MKQPKQPDIIIIKGAPGSGKSETAKNLSVFFPKGVLLEVDIIRKMVISVDWTNQQEHINMLELSAELASNFLKLGFYPIIVVDTFSGDKIIQYLKILAKHNNHLKVSIFGLFTTDVELKKRLGDRGANKFKDFSICKKLNDDTQKYKVADELLINTTGLLAKDTAQLIFNATFQLPVISNK